MVDKFIVYDVKTGETRIEEIEVEDVVEEVVPQKPTLDERVEYLENTLNELIVAVINNDTEVLRHMCLNK